MNQTTSDFRRCRVLGTLLFAPALLLASSTSATLGADTAGKDVLLKDEPKGAVDVLALKKDAQDEQEIVVIGRIGGRKNPWIKGMAAFPIVDRSLTPCNEREGDACKYPWDYCCESNLPQATVLVKFVDENGKIIKHDPRTYFDVKELQTVVVKGKTQRDKSGNVSILASQIHVRPDKQVTK